MKPKILKLPETVINQIAAGEVVENPASIVKELIENSLDAGAKHISIDLVGGGQQLIRIEDDGCGMGPEDALLSLERHATSKIRDVDDLQSLATMGFRGEALAAISSVCHFEMKTSNGAGTRIVAEGGHVTLCEPCARNPGTTIEVRSLFYNVPARKKFQKSASANASQVSRIFETLALAHPEVAFSLNGKEFAPTSQQQRIEEILGPHEHAVSSSKISGFVAAPSKAMATRTGQYLFINRRPVFSPLLSKAVKEAFATRIGEHSYPRFVLFLEVPPDSVDVNVHPQKKEVRFRDEGAMFRLVQSAVSQVFSSPFDFPEPIAFSPPVSFSFSETFASNSLKLAEQELQRAHRRDPTSSHSEMSPGRFSNEPLKTGQASDLLDCGKKHDAHYPRGDSSSLDEAVLQTQLPIRFNDRILTLIGGYLLLQRDHLIAVDLRAAFARILFESLKPEKSNSQALIWPLEIELARGEEEKAEQLNQIGIECRVLNRMLVVDALPPFLGPTEFPEFFAKWKEGDKIDQIATRFCRSSRKSFTFDEACHIWQRLQSCSDTLYDPLGKKIWSEIKEDQIAQMI